jgi:hypothetical protein
MTERFWVIGGDYTAMDFKALRPESRAIVGPFEDRTQAHEAWKQLSSEHSSRATTRFSIAAERVRLAG